MKYLVKYSVVRIETAKQQCLKGEHWKKPERKGNQQDNWTDDDERKLVGIFKQLKSDHKNPTHKQLNDFIDFVQFSGGLHATNARLKDMITIDMPNGDVIYKHFEKAWGEA